MKTLELKDLKWYLDTGLKMKAAHPSRRMNNIEELTIDNIRKMLYLKRIPLFLPLSAITEPLQDGTVPIVELAKIELSNTNNSINKIWNIESFDISKTHFCEYYESGDSFTLYWFQYHETKGFSKYIAKDGDFEPTELYISCSMFEYLYQNHFWLGDQSYFDEGLIIDKRTVKP